MKKILMTAILCLFFFNSAHALEIEKIDIHGFIAQGYLKTDKNNFFAETEEGTFAFNEKGINFTTQISPQLRVGAQVFSRDIGDYGNNEVDFNWAYGDYQPKRWIGFRAGRMKVPLALYSEIRDMDHLRTWIFLPQGVYHEIRRDTFASRDGGELYGTSPHSPIGTFSYRAQVGLLNMDVDDGNARFVESLVYPFFTFTDIRPRASYLGRVDWATPFDGLSFYVTYNEYKFDYEMYVPGTGTGMSMIGYFKDRDLFFGSELLFGDFTFAVEFLQEKEDQVISTVNDLLPRERSGWYASGAYRFNEWFEAGMYYSQYDPDASGEEYRHKVSYAQMTGGTVEKTYFDICEEMCLTLRYDVDASMTVKLEIHDFKNKSVFLAQDQEGLDGSQQSDDYQLYAIKCSYSF